MRQAIDDNKRKAKHWKQELGKLRTLHRKEVKEWGLVEDADDAGDADSGHDESEGAEEKGQAGDSDEEEVRAFPVLIAWK